MDCSNPANPKVIPSYPPQIPNINYNINVNIDINNNKPIVNPPFKPDQIDIINPIHIDPRPAPEPAPYPYPRPYPRPNP